MLHVFHASSLRYHGPSSRLFSKRLAGQSKQGWLDHCWTYVSERQWLTEGVPISWCCQCQSTFLSSANKRHSWLREPSISWRQGKGANRDQIRSTPYAHAATWYRRPRAAYRIVHYIPVPTSTPPTSLRRTWRSVCISAAPVTALAGCFIPSTRSVASKG